jgi:adenylate cyclase
MGGPSGADGPLLAFLVTIRALVWSDAPVPLPPPVAVLAPDRRSLETPELTPYPRTFLTPVWATILEGVFTAGARAVGFDFLFAYSATSACLTSTNPS